MKRFLLTICLAILSVEASPVLIAQTNVANQPSVSSIRWYTNYAQAVQDAQKSRLPLILFFTGSDWCGWCKKMNQEVFSSPQFAQEVGNSFIFVEIDFPMNKQLPPEIAQQNTKLKQKYNITGYPTIVVLDSDQNFVAESGYQAGGGKAYADYLKKLLSK